MPNKFYLNMNNSKITAKIIVLNNVLVKIGNSHYVTDVLLNSSLT